MFTAIGMGSGMLAIGVLFTRSDKVLPEFRRTMELLSLAVLLLLITVSTLTLDMAFGTGELPDIFAGGTLIVMSAVLIHLVRSTRITIET